MGKDHTCYAAGCKANDEGPPRYTHLGMFWASGTTLIDRALSDQFLSAGLFDADHKPVSHA